MSIKDQAIHLPCFFLNILTYECTLIDPLLFNSASDPGCYAASSPDNLYTKTRCLAML
jgi:hypothetical protein